MILPGFLYNSSDEDYNKLISGEPSGLDVIKKYLAANMDPCTDDERHNPFSSVRYDMVLEIFEYAKENIKLLIEHENDLKYMILAMYPYMSLDIKLKKSEYLLKNIGAGIYGSTKQYEQLLLTAVALNCEAHYLYWKINDPVLKLQIDNTDLPFEV